MATATVQPRSSWRSVVVTLPCSAPAVVAAIVLVILTAIVNPGFIGRGGWSQAVSSAAPFILLAIAEAPVILSGRGGVDMSVGPAAGLIGIVLATIIAPAGYTSPLYLVLAAV